MYATKQSDRLVVAVIALTGMVACGAPGITGVAPGPVGGTKATPTSMTAATGAATAGMSAPAVVGGMTPVQTSTGIAGAPPTMTGVPVAGAAGATTMGTVTGGAGMIASAAGSSAVMSGGAAGTTTGAAGTTGAAAGGGATMMMEQLMACPSGWTCENPAKPLADMGIADGTVTDDMGKPVMFSCGNGGQVDCDPKNPAGSCKDLAKPFCAHVAIPSLGVDLYSCAQTCKP